jgi:hypothetical protein
VVAITKLWRKRIPGTAESVTTRVSPLNEVPRLKEMKGKTVIEAFVGEIFKVGDMPGGLFWKKLNRETAFARF